MMSNGAHRPMWVSLSHFRPIGSRKTSKKKGHNTNASVIANGSPTVGPWSGTNRGLAIHVEQIDFRKLVTVEHNSKLYQRVKLRLELGSVGRQHQEDDRD